MSQISFTLIRLLKEHYKKKPEWQKGDIMNKRLRNVKLSIFDPEKRKWKTFDDMTVLLSEDFIYAIKSEPFYHAVDQKFKDSVYVSKLDDKATKIRKFNECFNEMLDECPISEKLQGVIYSGNTTWKVEMEDKPFCEQGGDFEE